MDGMGTRIRQLRQSRNLSIEELADILKLSPGFLGLVERNKRGTSYENIAHICKAFNVTADFLIFGDGDPPKYDEKDYNLFFNEVLAEDERNFVMEVAKSILLYKLSEKEFTLLLQTLQFNIKHLNQAKKLYELSAE